MKHIIEVKTFLDSYYMQIREETIKGVLKLERKMEQTGKFDPLLGESQFYFNKGKVVYHLGWCAH